MSKDSKAKSNNRWSTGLLNSKEREAMERYGLDPSDYGYNRPDRGTPRPGGTYEDMREDFTRAAMNDYDTRRALEASAMSGKKKATKLAEKGFKNPGDVMNANNLQRKQAERAGNGGSFSSASDFAGLTMNQVQRDRDKFESGLDKKYDAKYAAQSALEEMQQKIKDEATGTAGEPELSQALQEANDGIGDYNDDMTSFGDKLAGMQDDVGDAETEASMEAAGSSDAAQNYKDDYSSVVKGGLKLSGIETRGPRSGIRPGEGF